MPNILIADDHQIIIDGLMEILRNHKEYHVVATANSGSEAWNIIKKQKIDICILDIEMPGIDGVELTRMICEKFPDINILILTMYNRETFISEIMAIGSDRKKRDTPSTQTASAPTSTRKDSTSTPKADGNLNARMHQFGMGFILKNKGKEELVDALDALSKGDNYYGKEVMDTIMNSWTQAHRGPKKAELPSSPLDDISLTKREKQVLKLIAAGKSTPQISEELFIANSTVETHRRNLISKCMVENSKALMLFAVKNGLD